MSFAGYGVQPEDFCYLFTPDEGMYEELK